MTMRFIGTSEELAMALDKLGIAGSWHQEPNGVLMLRCLNGANVHWSSTRKTLWFDGNIAGQEQLLARIEKMVANREARHLGLLGRC